MILFLQIPFLYPLLEEKRNPELSGASFVITDTSQSKVLHPSIEAYRNGFRSGQNIVSGRLAIRIKPDRILYRSSESKIMSKLSEFSPIIEISKTGFFVDISGQEWRYGSIEAIAEEIINVLHHSYKTIFFIGIGSNKLICRLASDLLVPGLKSRFLHIPRHGEKLFLEKMPVSLLPDLSRDITEILYLLDIENINDLSVLPYNFLYQLFTESGSKLYKYARGISDEPVNNIFSKDYLFADIALSPTNNLSVIKGHIYSLFEAVCYELRNIQKKGDRGIIYIGFEDRKYLIRHIRLKNFSFLESEYFETLISNIDLGRIRRININYIGMKIYNLIPVSAQRTLFNPPVKKREKLLDIIYDIRKKYGSSKLCFKGIN